MHASTVMTPNHPQWPGFYADLCKLKVCDHGFGLATRILGKMPEIDTALTLKYFRNHSAFCDCEILFNIA